MTQRERVLAALRAAGKRGVSTGQFLELRIPRFSARVEELRAQGFAISSQRLSAGSWRYTLLNSPSAPEPQAREKASLAGAHPPAPAGGELRLFTPPAEKPARTKHWQQDAA